MKQTVRLTQQEVGEAIVLYLATKGLQPDDINLETHTDFLGRRTHTIICRGVTAREPMVVLNQPTFEKLKRKLVDCQAKEKIRAAAKSLQEKVRQDPDFLKKRYLSKEEQ